MSLVAYGSSDESSEDEGSNRDVETAGKPTEVIAIKQTTHELCLPAPKHNTLAKEVKENKADTDVINTVDPLEKIHFDKLPKPKSLSNEPESIAEDDDIPPNKEIELKPEKPIKKDRAPVKITVPSLSDFKDVEEDNETKSTKIKLSNKGTKLFALLPPPKGAEVKSAKNLIPRVINKPATKANEVKDPPGKYTQAKNANTSKGTKVAAPKGSIGISYDSNSEDEDDAHADGDSSTTTDFFALTSTETVSNSIIPDSSSNIQLKNLSDLDSEVQNDSNKDNSKHTDINDSSTTVTNETYSNNLQKTLVSNVMNMPKEEILLKNKAEVGPKLPVPEQEYNVDTEGNVAFDEKAIEYLCGKRGIKRKNKEIEEANIIEISGEDIKPDEREWLVKALTEEPVQRPVSMQGGGVSSQSKKKHQITYLAHQAKAMEMELKNQWAQNRMTRKQTQSKYGF